jgi:putative cell wall-binding protein
MLDRDELLDILQEIRLQLPDDLRQAKWVKEERARILAEAQKEANVIIKGAEEKIVSMINEHEITKKSYEAAKHVEAVSRKKSRDIKNATTTYVEQTLADAEDVLERALKTLQENRTSMRTQQRERQDNSSAMLPVEDSKQDESEPVGTNN